MADEKQTICGICGEYFCSWIDKLIPVKGWTAIPSKLRNSNGIYDDSYIVTKCPLFKKMRPGSKLINKKISKQGLTEKVLELMNQPRTVESIVKALVTYGYDELSIKTTISYLSTHGKIISTGKTKNSKSRICKMFIRSDLI